MKSKLQKQKEAIERNKKYKGRYAEQAKKMFPDDECEQRRFIEKRIGIPKRTSVALHEHLILNPY
jgi:hypothetical protein